MYAVFCRLISCARKSETVTGWWEGFKVVVLGNFYQLRPVPNHWTQDLGNYCFVSNLWPHLIPHAIVLTSVQRQDDSNFINAISETARGCPSLNSISLIHSLKHSKERSTVLFPEKMMCSWPIMNVYWWWKVKCASFPAKKITTSPPKFGNQ